MRQIDIEEAIAEKAPLTVRAFAEKNGVPEWRVRKSISLGTLEADQRKRPMVVKEGELAMTVTEWQRALMPAVDRIKPSVCAWIEGGRKFQVLDESGKVHTWTIALVKSIADSQRREIDRVTCKRMEVAR